MRMLINYDEASDVLHLRFSSSRLLRNHSQYPLIEIWFDGDDRLIEVTVHDTNAHGHWPLELVLLPSSKSDDDEQAV